jgi:ABC-2 type transport system permease protein
MFASLFAFEFRNRLLRWSSLIYFLVYLTLAFLIGITFAGAFKGASVNFGLSNKLVLNSPVVLSYLTCFLSYLGLLVVAPIFGQSINQDFESGFQQILFATPIRKFTYFFVRYWASAIASLAILSSLGIGLWIATLMPFVDQSLVGPNHLSYYLNPYFYSLIPNVLIFGAIFISVVSFTKKMAPVYVASIAVFTGWMISQNITSDLDNKLIASLIEPFGLEATSQVTRYWSVAEQSTQNIPVTGFLLYNRLLWLAVGLLFLIVGYVSFNPFKAPSSSKKKKKATEADEKSYAKIDYSRIQAESKTSSWKVFLGLAVSEFKQAFSNIYFLMILLCGLLYIFAISGEIGKFYGTGTLPVTYHVLDVVSSTFGLFVIIITTYYAGELVWKDRELKFNELVDSKPVSNLYLYLSKLLSLSLIQIFLALVIFVCCILIQTFKGYHNYEFAQYFKHLIVYWLPAKILTCVFALFVQSLSRNKYVGHSIVILYYIALLWLPGLGLDHKLYLVGVLPRAFYSDMNHYGATAWPFFVFAVYWGLFHIALADLTVLFWRRGSNVTWKERRKEFFQRINGTHKALITSSLVAWASVGGFIFYNTNILNTYKTSKQAEQERVHYELRYKSYEHKAIPELIDVNVNADIYPETQQLRASAQLIYRNKTKEDISEFLMSFTEKMQVKKFVWSKEVSLIKKDDELFVSLYKFTTPLKPDEEVTLDYEVEISPRGFENSEFSKKIVENGTFFYGEDFVPLTGYSTGGELELDKTRRKYDLPDRPRMNAIDDKAALNKTYISSDATWINFEATVSTTSDQIAIAPGYLQKEWHEGSRRYFHYKMDRPILNFYAFMSARYEVLRDKWNDVNIEIYYHPGHTLNLQRMVKSIKNSFEYFTKNFSPYQFRQARILEFPRYQSFAQAFPNTIPYSEAIGFIAKVDDSKPTEIDFAYYVTAHEIAHQWWAHQVIGGNVQGSTMLSESLAQYSALMVMEKEYGPLKMRKFLKYELDRYLKSRGSETKKELPLAYNENQPYIHYNKGSIVFYALKDYLGEDVVNKVLHDYIKDVAFQDAPFTRSLELVERFRKVASPEQKHLIVDLFETITLWDNQTRKVTYKKNEKGYLVTITTQNQKLRADELGKETEVPLEDMIDIGVSDKEGNFLYLQKHLVKSGANEFKIQVDKMPDKAGVDPINKLIDRIPDDNLVMAEEVK